MFSVQCTMKKGNRVQTSWIPEKYAKKGKILKLKDDDEWTDGWEVINVGSRMESKQVHERSRDYTHQRKASDI